MTYTFVWYPSHPIACEGNDDDGQARVFRMKLKQSTIDQVIAKIEKMLGGYVQCW